jgi:pimeloyl-ACP methyl ester carboxylesterase
MKVLYGVLAKIIEPERLLTLKMRRPIWYNWPHTTADGIQKEGRYVEVPTLLLYSAANLGKRYSMKEIWEKFVNNRVTAHAVGDEAGHFVNEENPEECTRVFLEWLKTL